MKNLIKKLVMVAVVVAIGFVSYMITSKYYKISPDYNVVIQKKSCTRSSDCGSRHHCARPNDPSAIWGVCHKN